jgi:hypothetical protein
MNEQEMQFADPDWQPTEQAPLTDKNTPTHDFSTQPAKGDADDGNQGENRPGYEQGYRGQPRREWATRLAVQPGETKHQRNAWWIWMVAPLLLLALVIGLFGLAPHSGSYRHAEHPGFSLPIHEGSSNRTANTYSLAGASRVAIANPDGAITVQVAKTPTNSILVKTDGSQANVSYAENSILITSDGRAENITVTVPQNIVLHLRTGQGNIQVNDFNGQMTAQSDTGAITLSNDNLSGESLVSSYAGDILLQQGSISDFATLNNYVGSLSLNQEKLSGQIVLRTDGNGNINVHGTLDPLGSYQFITNSGNIELSLPASTALKVQLNGGTGSYHSDFVNSTSSSPQAEVIVQSGSGAVAIHKQR